MSRSRTICWFYVLIVGTYLAVQRLDTGGSGPNPIQPTPNGMVAVLIEDMQARVQNRLPESQVELLTSTAPGSLVKYLESHCMKGPSGAACWRILDKSTDVSQDLDWVKSAKAYWQSVPGQPTPYWILSNGKKWRVGNLPLTKPQALPVLTSVGGE